MTDKVSSTTITDEGLISDVFSKITDCIGYIVTENCSYQNSLHTNGYLPNGNQCPGYEYDRFYYGCGGSGGSSSGSGPTSGAGGPTSSDVDDVTTTTLPPLPYPCSDLKDLIQDDTNNDNSVPNIKPDLELLKTTLQESGENGTQFKKNTGTYSSDNLPATTSNSIAITAGGDNYGAAHTHPLSTFPMFSWSDVYTLFNLHQNARAAVKDHVTFIVIANSNGAAAQPNIYAIKINDFRAFRNQINNDFVNIVAKEKRLNISSPISDKIDALNEDLGEEYRKESNAEKVFIEQFGNHNISLYKANDDITNWNELTLGTDFPYNGTVIETPCN